MAIWGMSHAYELANEQASRQLQRMATRDHLTGLMNRRVAAQRFSNLHQQGFDTFALIDLDQFKIVAAFARTVKKHQ